LNAKVNFNKLLLNIAKELFQESLVGLLVGLPDALCHWNEQKEANKWAQEPKRNRQKCLDTSNFGHKIKCIMIVYCCDLLLKVKLRHYHNFRALKLGP